ncbi:MAG TPA: hypothetical protein VLS45_09665 [Methylomicrobium sp.]|nr:hypothetical protein [Methylomicrobium sp.]
MENDIEKAMTAEDIRSRIEEIEKQINDLTSSGLSSALGGLAGLSVSSFIPALIPGIGWAIGAMSAVTGTGLASVILKKKRELQKELEELKERLHSLETIDNSNTPPIN